MSSERRTLLIGLAVFLAFSVYTSVFSPIAPRQLETYLQSAADDALSARRFRWASVSVDGQVATLSGRWPNETEHSAALEALWSAEWSGGWLAGGITRIIDNSIPQPGEAESRIVAVYNSDGVTLSGIAPGDAARTGLIEQVSSLFRGRIEPRLAARSGNNNPDDWLESAMTLLTGLERLERGAVILDTDSAVLYGVSSSSEDARQILESIGNIAGTIQPVALILADDEVLGRIDSARDCEMLLDAAFAMGRLRFNPGSASLSPGARAGLEHVAAVFAVCPSGALGVSVRPVVSGNSEAETLARSRAESVRNALVTFGIDENRVSALVSADQDQLVRIVLDGEGEG
ncbi:OmpA family protein [Hyphobacterium sp.]|uniref:OmpA family protein n=1 Tax=Hyphobacterium sp. TaxID=2004662 RepID=UPI003749697A